MPAAFVPASRRRRPLSRRNLRLASGLVLLAYAGTHLVNHALGLYSIDAAEAMLQGAVMVWFSLPGTVLLYGAATLHVALAFVALYERRTLRMPLLEASRYALGFAIPWLVIPHVFGARVAASLGASPAYERIVWQIVQNDAEWRQVLLIAVVWGHGMIGVTLWLRHRAWFARWSHVLLVAACLVPVLGLLGFLSMARELTLRADEPDAITAQAGYASELRDEARARIGTLRDDWTHGYLVLLGAALAARLGRRVVETSRRTTVTITYPDAEVQVPRGHTVLEASRAHHIPHLALCGGRARCSTCRVRVAPAEGLPPPGRDEAATLASINAPPDVRLACQLRPTHDVSVWPVFAIDGSQAPPGRGSVEREIVVLFTDLRRWTGLAERQLPFDLVYVQNQFYAAVGDAVVDAGGLPNQFVGDSVMAIFGLEVDAPTACRQALAAVHGIEARMREVNVRMRRQFAHTLDFGVGLHAGAAVVGEVGYRDTRTVSAVGDTVNTAARLQELTKKFGVRLVLSEVVASGAGLDVAGRDAHEIEVRGRKAPLTIYAIGAADALPSPARVPV
ncbi:MAG TPA: adenylate/guanylate cyclase domain-containing protein [Casimicrobiaceae bacterium]|nr:adenylate/guanylate cyclase domain-containing protein [Casimicrobiaceae bacterium]